MDYWTFIKKEINCRDNILKLDLDILDYIKE